MRSLMVKDTGQRLLATDIPEEGNSSGLVLSLWLQ